MIKVIEDSNRIKILQNKFHDKLFQLLNETEYSFVGFPAGSFRDNVHFSSQLKIWASFHKEKNRYWNGFGVGIPVAEKGISLVGEINFPFKGINRRIAGVFAEDKDKILILHRGKIGGGTAGVGKNLFFEKFGGEKIKAIDDDRETTFALVAELDSEYFIEQIASFIHGIYNIKKGKTIEFSNSFEELLDFTYTDEKFGVTITENNEPKTINRIHGIIVNSLAKELKSKNLLIGKDKNRDIFIHKNNKISTLFEIKTNSNTQSLYSAVGQLIVYSMPIGKINLIAVLPNKLDSYVEKKLSDIGIKILYYKWENKQPIFPELEKFI